MSRRLSRTSIYLINSLVYYSLTRLLGPNTIRLLSFHQPASQPDRQPTNQPNSHRLHAIKSAATRDWPRSVSLAVLGCYFHFKFHLYLNIHIVCSVFLKTTTTQQQQEIEASFCQWSWCELLLISMVITYKGAHVWLGAPIGPSII